MNCSCGNTIPAARAKLGYTNCIPCAEQQPARRAIFLEDADGNVHVEMTFGSRRLDRVDRLTNLNDHPVDESETLPELDLKPDDKGTSPVRRGKKTRG